jgi:hypothetical protein
MFGLSAALEGKAAAEKLGDYSCCTGPSRIFTKKAITEIYAVGTSIMLQG